MTNLAITSQLCATGRHRAAARWMRAGGVRLAVMLLVAQVLWGCSSQRSFAPSASPAAMSSHHRPARAPDDQMSPAPARIVSTSVPSRDETIRHAAETELGPEVAASMPRIPPAPPHEPIDPGAEMIVKSIDHTLNARAANDQGITVISVNEVRNLSRCGGGEFASFMNRFAALLSNAGSESKITFTDDTSAAVQYRMQGTAYLMTAEGFDQWELFLSLTPGDRDFSVWDARNAVRVLRMPRAGQPEITYIGK